MSAAETELKQLRNLVYVPGLWRCAKCKFQLVQANLHASNGAVTSRDQPGDKCPNCDVPLWRVTEREAGNQLADRLEQEIERAHRLEAALRRLWDTAKTVTVDSQRGCFVPDGEWRRLVVGPAHEDKSE